MPQTTEKEILSQTENSQRSDLDQRERTPLPWNQLSILLLLQFSEPITSQVVTPFLPQLIRDTGVTHGKDSRIGYYVGLMHSLFFLTEACTIFHWSRTSDYIGRRPVLLTGLFGLSVSMWCFGLSRTIWALVLSRCLSGALNGNIGVIKSMVAEITDSTNVARAYGMLPVTWFIGITVGPLIGGSLATPADRFPHIFGSSAFLKKYPYFLPCSVSATFTTLSWLVTFLFLKETTRAQMTPIQYCLSWITKDRASEPEGQVPVFCDDGLAPETVDGRTPFRALLVRPVLIATGSYATFSLIDMAFRAILPVFYAMPVGMGGLDLGPPTIGLILALLGISGGIIQWLFFTPMYNRLGAKWLFVVSIAWCIPMIALFPVINMVARAHGLGYSVWILVALQLILFIFANFSFSLSFIFLSAAAPNQASIGATNGIAQMVVSAMRSIGPAAVTSAFSFSVGKHIMVLNLAYWVLLAMVGMALWVGYLLPRKLWNE